jgi:hypothetical protein
MTVMTPTHAGTAAYMLAELTQATHLLTIKDNHIRNALELLLAENGSEAAKQQAIEELKEALRGR